MSIGGRRPVKELAQAAVRPSVGIMHVNGSLLAEQVQQERTDQQTSSGSKHLPFP
jgi:hypothetical protein